MEPLRVLGQTLCPLEEQTETVVGSDNTKYQCLLALVINSLDSQPWRTVEQLVEG